MKNFIVVFLFFNISFFAQVQNESALQKQLTYADSLFRAENYFDAITEYKRYIFFSTGKYDKYFVNFRIGEAYKTGGYFHNAIKYFSKALLETKEKEEFYKAKIKIIRCRILMRDFNLLYKEIENLLKDENFIGWKDEILYWKGWSLMFQMKWEEAKNIFEKLKNRELEVLCSNAQKQIYSAKTAKFMSYIIPGSGQIYAKEYFSGLMSFGWNVLTGYITVSAIVAQRVLDAFLIGDILWLRFYRGNLQNIEKIIKTKNIEISNKFFYYLQNEFSGLKP